MHKFIQLFYSLLVLTYIDLMFEISNPYFTLLLAVFDIDFDFKLIFHNKCKQTRQATSSQKKKSLNFHHEIFDITFVLFEK